jgi:hypothetical protein
MIVEIKIFQNHWKEKSPAEISAGLGFITPIVYYAGRLKLLPGLLFASRQLQVD